MDFKKVLIDIFNEKNITTDSTYEFLENGLLDLNLRIYNYIDGKIPILLNKDLNCLHELKFQIDKNIISETDNTALYNVIFDKFTEHIDYQLEKEKLLYLCIFVYSIKLENDTLIVEGNFKFKK
jgi:hypothetical protein